MVFLPASAHLVANADARRLGRTGILISEVSLGGHGWKTSRDRVPVLQRAVELGMNYLDTNMVSECDVYGEAMDGKLRGTRRDSWIIGFASWPQKLTTEYEKELSKERFIREIDARLKTYRTDMLDICDGEGRLPLAARRG